MIFTVNFITFIALVGLNAFMSTNQVQANLYLVNASNHTIDKCYDFPTSFSAKLPSDGLWGHHVFSEPADGCGSLVPPPSGKTWFAVILHTNKCHNVDRALSAQTAGFKAVIIYLNDSSVNSDDEEKSEISTRVKIPTTIVGILCMPTLVHYEKDLNTYTVLYGNSSENIWLFLVVAVSGIILVILCSGSMAWLIHICCGKKKSIGLLSRWKLKKLKVHVYQSGDTFEVCAICIEDYQIGDKLRILPCAHAFHCSCVDVWLTENRKTCPLCNKAADTRRRRQRHGNNHVNEDDDERTPLLSDDLLPDDQTDDGHEVTDRGQNASTVNQLPSVFVRHPGDRESDSSRSFAEVHEDPASRCDRLPNYGSISALAPDGLAAPERNDGSLSTAQNLSASPILRQDSVLSGSSSSCPA